MKTKKLHYFYTFLSYLLAFAISQGQAQVKNSRNGFTYSTIQTAISAGTTLAGDNLQINAGTFSEIVTVNKSITLSGSGSSTIITPSSGNGITISSNSVTISNLRVTGASKFGVYTTTGVSALSLSGIVCDSDSVGAELDNVNGLTVTGCTFSYNKDYGLFSSGGQNFTLSNCVTNGNGKTYTSTGSGMKFRGLTGSSTITNSTVDSNQCHGIEIGGGIGTQNITINGGEFSYNGSSNLYNGGGIYIFARSATVSNVTINGPIIANNNFTSGIYVDANTGSTDSIKGLSIGQSGGSVTFTSNGNPKGAGVLLWGNISDATITANFSKGTVSNSAGVIIIGQNSSGDSSPRNVSLANCTFQAGYANLTPAISLADAQPSHNKIGINNVTATGNTFLGLSNLSDVPTVIYDHNNDAALGRVIRSGDILPVEIVSFNAEAIGSDVRLQWSTATEVNNYGFEVERRAVNSDQLSVTSWKKIGFVQGNGMSNTQHQYDFFDQTLASGRYAYRLKQLDNDGSFKYSQSIEVAAGSVPKVLTLSQNYPNPFNPTTTIEFTIPETERITLAVYNILGQNVQTIFSGVAEAGIKHKVAFDASRLTSGYYFYLLDFRRTRIVRKMTIMK